MLAYEASKEMSSGAEAGFFSGQVVSSKRFFVGRRPLHGRPHLVVGGGVERCKPEYEVDRSAFPYTVIEYVVGGRGEAGFNGKRANLGPGCLVCYDESIQHKIISDSSDPLVKYFAAFSGDGAAEMLRHGDLTPGSVVQIFPPDALSGLFDELIAVGSQAQSEDGILCAKLLECLLLKSKGMRAPATAKDAVAFARFVEYRDHIKKHFIRLRSLEQIAEECRVSVTHICHLFQRYEAQTPYQYLTRLKMSFAAEQIQNGALVKQAADLLGYGDPFHFSRVFRKSLGVSPEKWRVLQRTLADGNGKMSAPDSA